MECWQMLSAGTPGQAMSGLDMGWVGQRTERRPFWLSGVAGMDSWEVPQVKQGVALLLFLNTNVMVRWGAAASGTTASIG